MQFSFEKNNWKHRYSYGGTLRKMRSGRKARPLSTKDFLHLILKAEKQSIRGGFRTSKRFALIHKIIRRYQSKFFIKIDSYSIQGDHLHLLIKASRRSNYQSFFRVLAGQIAQQFENEGLLTDNVTGTPQRAKRVWKYRPFSRVVRGYRDFQTVRNYIQLNEKEARGEIPYRKERLRGLSSADWKILWA